MNEKNYAMMAFSLGEDNAHSGEGSFAKYQGVAIVNVVGVNPNKEQLDKFLGFETKEAPVYINKDANDRTYIDLDFMIKTIPDQNNGIELNRTLRYRLYKEVFKSNDGSKIQVIDDFGRTSWLNEEEFKNHVIPKWDDGSDKISENYRPAYRGEEPIVAFLKTYLGIGPLSYRDKRTGKIVFAKDPDKCKAKLDKIDNYFKGDISEIVNIIKSRPDNRVKVCIGIKTGDDNKTSMIIFADEVIPVWQGQYDRVQNRITARQNDGAYANVEFSMLPLHEYVVEASDFSDAGANTQTDNPFEKKADSAWPF